MATNKKANKKPPARKHLAPNPKPSETPTGNGSKCPPLPAPRAVECGVNGSAKQPPSYFGGIVIPDPSRQRIYVPKNSSALIFRPGLPIDGEVIQQLIDQDVLPDKWPIFTPRLSPYAMADEVKTRILAHYTRDDQNRFIQELVDAIRKHRADQLNQVKIALEANEKNLDELQGHADALELILDGTLGRLKLG